MLKYLIFKIDDMDYAISIKSVSEIIEFVKPTELPNSADYSLGIINHRGVITPLIDMSLKLSTNSDLEKVYTKQNRIILVSKGSKLVGLVVDSTNNIIELDEEEIDKRLYISGKCKSNFVTGIGKIGDKLVVILNVENLIA